MGHLLNSENALLLVIDIQDKFKPVIHDAGRLIQNTQRLINGCQLLEIPVVVTEQYPKGLGRTIEELQNILD